MRDPRYWRPDLVPGQMDHLTVTTVSSPMAGSPRSDANSSQEILNPEGEAWYHGNQVSIHQTFKLSAGE